MAVRIKPQAAPEACFADELFFGHALNVFDEPAVGIVSLLQHFGERQVFLLPSSWR